MKRVLFLCATVLLFPAIFVAGIMFADYGDPNPASPPSTYSPPPNLGDMADAKTVVAGDVKVGVLWMRADGTYYFVKAKGVEISRVTPPPVVTVTLTPTVMPSQTVTESHTLTPTPTLPPTATRTPTVTRTATNTVVATQTPTRTPTRTNTPDVEASPTQDDEPQPTPEPGEEKVCLVRNLSGGPYNVRANHASSATIVGQVPTSEYAVVVSVYVIQDVTSEWFHVTYGNVTGWMLRSDDDLLFGAADTLDICLDATLTPTEYASNPPPSPVPTLAGPTPTPLPDIPIGCTVINNTSSNLNTRSGPGLNYAVIGKLAPGETGQAIQTYSNGEEVWINFSRLSAGGSNVYSWVARFIPAQGNLAALTGPCEGLPSMAAHETVGIHVLGGFQKTWDILAEIEHFSLLKITDDSFFLAAEAKKINPSITVIQRNIHLTGLGLRNCPDGWAAGDPIAVARNWFAVQMETWGARGLLGTNSPIDFFEERNECIWAGQWEVAYQKEIIRLANEAHICLAVFSYFYGYPEPEQFAQLTPVLDAMLATECKPGKSHILAVHTYGNVSSGIFIWGRWKMLRDAVIAINPRYAALEWAMTEFGLTNQAGQNDGRGPVDCSRAAIETQQAVTEYKKHPEVLGFAIFSLGAGTEWSDYTPCLSQIAAALQ